MEELCPTCGMPQVKVTAFRSKPRVICIDPNCETNKEPDVVVGECTVCKAAGKQAKLIAQKNPRTLKRFIRCENHDECGVGYPLPQYGKLTATDEVCEHCGAPLVIVTTARGPVEALPELRLPRARSQDDSEKAASKGKKTAREEVRREKTAAKKPSTARRRLGRRGNSAMPEMTEGRAKAGSGTQSGAPSRASAQPATAPKIDRRILFTKGLIKEAFLELKKSSSLADIKVTDLCERAGIGRGTFYRHYRNMTEVLDEVLDDAFSQSSSLARHLVSREIRTAGACSGCDMPFCQFVRENKPLRGHLFGREPHARRP